MVRRIELKLVDEYLSRGVDRALVVNFGGQYAHLIARRLREAGVYATLARPEEAYSEAERLKPVVIVLSGGPRSVYEEQAPRINVRKLLDYTNVLVGICYGHQLIAYDLGGSVERGEGEYGRTKIKIIEADPIFSGWSNEEIVWMSHADYVSKIPPGFKVLALSEKGYIAAMRGDVEGKIVYGFQFHPEVKHTPKGKLLFENLVARIALARRRYAPEDLVSLIIDELRKSIPEDDHVLVAVSGGVDSVTTAILLRKAIGDRLVTVFVDHGLLREGEAESVVSMLNKLKLNPIVIDAKNRFLTRLIGVKDCEERRRIIGEEFAKIFQEIAKSNPKIKWLAQGTLYPDVIESGAIAHSSRIKSHHNVGGLPEWLGLGVIEPLRYFYKDEVRRIARRLGVPEEIVNRHPFPGPGLAVRIIGEFTLEKLRIVRRASRIVEEELKRAGIYDKVWQAFAVVGDDKWVGVKGDARAEGYIVIVRVVESEDAMTADYTRIPYDVLDRISFRITSEIPEVTMVAYAITTKPPATIEPC